MVRTVFLAILLACLVFIVTTVLHGVEQGPRPPQAPPTRKWDSPVPYPEGMQSYTATKYTQSIYVLNDRDTIDRVPIKKLEPKWHQSGGMANISGWKSQKYRLIPESVRDYIGTIEVKNSFGHYQPNRGLKRSYPDGTRFDDVLTNDQGAVFEHRTRRKSDGKWESEVAYRNVKARPDDYDGLKQSCASCHNEAGSGGYAVGLVPGGDTVLSDPLDWSLPRKHGIGGTNLP